MCKLSEFHKAAFVYDASTGGLGTAGLKKFYYTEQRKSHGHQRKAKGKSKKAKEENRLASFGIFPFANLARASFLLLPFAFLLLPYRMGRA